jgi:hypothetical protein
MAITVYWACLEQEWLRAQKPVPIWEKFITKNDIPDTNIQYCPAFKKSLKNVYGLKSIYDYRFTVNQATVTSDLYDQNFFNEHVIVRSNIHKVYSFQTYYIFFTEAKSLLMTANMYPALEDTELTKNCLIYPGTFDIGKWYRNIEFAIRLKKDSNCFSINEGEIYSYLKFHTDTDIKFVQYRNNEVLEKYLKECVHAKMNKIKFKKLEDYYFMFKTKKMIINEIKKNIL